MTSDSIIQGCLKGDKLCQRKLVELYAPMLFTVARRYSHNTEDAEDVLQDALIKMLLALENNKYSEKGKFESWMRTITITTALNNLDRTKLFSDMDVEASRASDMSCPPEAYSHLGAEELMELIDQMPAGYKQIFNLSVIETYTHKEIADMLGINEVTSRTQLMRARKHLQKLIMNLEKIRL